MKGTPDSIPIFRFFIPNTVLLNLGMFIESCHESSMFGVNLSSLIYCFSIGFCVIYLVYICAIFHGKRHRDGK